MVDFSKLLKERSLEHVSAWVVARGEDPKPIALEEFKGMQMNSYERDYLFPKFADDTLLWLIEHALQNCGRQRSPPLTYVDAIIGKYMPDLVLRYKMLLAANEALSPQVAKLREQIHGNDGLIAQKYAWKAIAKARLHAMDEKDKEIDGLQEQIKCMAQQRKDDWGK